MTLVAFTCLKQIIPDSIGANEASDAAMLHRKVAQAEVDWPAHWLQKHLSSYGRMLSFLLDWVYLQRCLSVSGLKLHLG